MLCFGASGLERRRAYLGLTPPQPQLVFQAEAGRAHIGRAECALRGMVVGPRWRYLNGAEIYFIAMNPPSTTASAPSASGKALQAAPSPFDSARFDHLSEAEILRWIGELLATALVRSGRLGRRPNALAGRSSTVTAARIDPLDLIDDPVQRQLARFLQYAGPTAPRHLATALGVSRRTTVRKLTRLRACGICEVIGRTKGALYRLRADRSRN
jgi:DNA-binding transcriptional ArsR family regulator